MNLYEITKSYLEIQNIIEAQEQDDDMLAKCLETLAGDITEKAENIAKVLKNIDANVDAIANEQKRLANKKQSLENSKERLKDYLKNSLVACGMDKVKSDLFTISIRKAPASVVIDDELLIDDKYYKITKAVSKTLIKEALQNGDIVDGARLDKTNTTLTIL